MSRLGVIQYSNAEGGSGFIPNAYAPSHSTFDITQLSPVYDQDTAWLRQEDPGRFTYYPTWGQGIEAQPIDTSCGMGDLVLTRSDVVAPMPSITDTARGCSGSFTDPCSAGGAVASAAASIASWADDNPGWALALAVAAAVLIFGGNGNKNGTAATKKRRVGK